MTTFHDRLLRQTADARNALQSVPIIRDALAGQASREAYVAFLTEAWHHVRHTVPLLEACRDALPAHLAWMRPALEEYVVEERGHDDWILDDLAACGVAPERIRSGRPSEATELMLAYAYDTIARGRAVAFLGMVHVLEGTSVALATAAADRIQSALALPDRAFTYLRSHGSLDVEHTRHFADLVDAIADAADRDAIVHAARMFYRLYADVFRGLPRADVAVAA
jgi:pyrroloquinoline quinone (PQQ) biosynthesis protein C